MSKLKDLTGNTYGYLYVIERLPNYRQKNGRTRTRWLTKCLRCGKEYVADGSHMLHGDIVSCGCLKNDKAAERAHAAKGKSKRNPRTKDLAGQTINGIKIIGRAPTIKHKVAWECVCPFCGSHFVARANHLLRNLIRSCGCVSSFAERDIRDYLNNHNVHYDTQYWFDDLRNEKSNKPYMFDFAFLDNNNELIALLEYQGEQHDKSKTSEFGRQQREITDELKKEYCKAHNINLIEIWYYEDLNQALDNIMINVLHVNPVPSSDKEKV